MWSQTFILADRIKATLLAWTVGLVVAATAADQVPFSNATISNATIMPLSILGILAQTYIVTAALRIGLDADAQAAIRPRFARVFGISIATTLAIALGGLLLIIPGVFLLIRWWIAVPIALDRDMDVSESMRESWKLIAAHWAAILGMFLVLLAIFVIPLIGLFFFGGFDDGTISVPMSLAINIVMHGVLNLGTVSTVAAYRTIYQPVTQLRQVFE